MNLRLPSHHRILSAALLLCLGTVGRLRAEDWPQWRGLHRDGVWHETGLLKSFPKDGLNVRWRVPIGTGFSTPCVVQGKVYVTDSTVTRAAAAENIHCLDASSGKAVWRHTYPVEYPEWGADPDHPYGPAATPVVSNGKIYTVGRMSNVLCLDAATGRVLWHKDLPKQYGTKEDLRGFSCSPLIEGDLLIMAIAKSAQVSIVALNKNTGDEVWEALDDIPSNSSPIVITSAGQRQIIVWAYKSVAALDPRSGRILWRMPVNTGQTYTVATPAWKGEQLLLGGLMLKLASDKPDASVLWPADVRPSRVHVSDTSTPLIQGSLVFSPTAKGQLLCLDAGTGNQRWQASPLAELKNGSSIHMTTAPDIGCMFLFTDRGDLLLARLTATGYEEISRFHLLDPTSDYGGRKMAWVPPAYADRCVFARSDKELVCASLAATP